MVLVFAYEACIVKYLQLLNMAKWTKLLNIRIVLKCNRKMNPS